MNQLQAFSLAVFPIEPVSSQPVRAAVALPHQAQLDEVVEWFTGNFDNAAQVSRDPSVPLITLSTCSVQLGEATEPFGTQALYLEQPEINRIRFYSFSPRNDTVKLSIRSFVNPNSLSGICSRPLPERAIDPDNLTDAVCILELFREDNSYMGSNAPIGCPTSTDGKVVSSITFEKNSTISLDQIYSSSGQLIAGTTIEFRRQETE